MMCSLFYRLVESEQDHMILQQDLNMLYKWTGMYVAIMSFHLYK